MQRFTMKAFKCVVELAIHEVTKYLINNIFGY